MFKNTPKFSKVFLIIYVVAGAALFITPKEWLLDFYRPSIMATLAFISAFIIILPRLIFKPKDKMQESALKKLQNVLTASLLINGAGGLGLYKLYQYGFQYDKLTHYVTPLILTLGFVYFFINYSKWARKKALWLTSVLVFAGGILWEVLEWTSDKFLDTTFVLGGGGIGWTDTKWDVIANTLGIISALLILKWRKKD